MMRSAWVGLMVVALLLAAGCSGSGGDESSEETAGAAGPEAGMSMSAEESATVPGTVTYRERIALPPQAELTVRLVDLDDTGGVASVVAEQQKTLGDAGPPYAFTLNYAPHTINEGLGYIVRARIAVDGTVRFSGEIDWDALTPEERTAWVQSLKSGTPDDVGLVLRSGDLPSPQPVTELEQTTWRLTSIGGDAPQTEDAMSPLILKFLPVQGRMSGSGGVNTFSGTYELEGDSMSFEVGISTLMSGPPDLMEQEDRVKEALASVTGYRLEGDTLELLAGDEVVLRYTRMEDA